MATVKHINIHNSNYNSAVEYLTYEHDELTKKPIRDASGRMIEYSGVAEPVNPVLRATPIPVAGARDSGNESH